MAQIPVHRSITKSVLREHGFSDKACKIAADANARVDKKQGNNIEEAHLHAMLGMVYSGIDLVPEDKTEGITKINALIDQKREEIVLSIKKIDHRKLEIDEKFEKWATEKAIKKLGAALHTVQDREFHGFEVWPHNGLVEACLKDPWGTAMHAVHDLGETDISINSASNNNGRHGVSINVGWVPITTPILAPLGIGRWMARNNLAFFYEESYAAGGGEPLYRQHLFGLRYGPAAPAPIRRINPHSHRGPLGGIGAEVGMLEWKGGISSEPINNVRPRAEEASQRFVDRVKHDTDSVPGSTVGKSPWGLFKYYSKVRL